MKKYAVKKCPAIHSVLGHKFKCKNSIGGLASCSDIENCFMKKLIDGILKISKKRIKVFNNDNEPIAEVPVKEIVGDLVKELSLEEIK